MRPLGTTCARSLSGYVVLLFLAGCTRRVSSASGLKRPPLRSLERSVFSRSRDLLISDSSVERSNGSVSGVEALGSEGRVASRAALPPFLKGAGVALKERAKEGYWGSGVHCVVVSLEARPRGMLIGKSEQLVGTLEATYMELHGCMTSRLRASLEDVLALISRNWWNVQSDEVGEDEVDAEAFRTAIYIHHAEWKRSSNQRKPLCTATCILRIMKHSNSSTSGDRLSFTFASN